MKNLPEKVSTVVCRDFRHTTPQGAIRASGVWILDKEGFSKLGASLRSLRFFAANEFLELF